MPSLLEQITGKISLRKTESNKIVNEDPPIASSSKLPGKIDWDKPMVEGSKMSLDKDKTLLGRLSNKFDQIRKAVNDDEDVTENVWDEDSKSSINKLKALESVEDLSIENKAALEIELENIKPDDAINIFKNRTEFAEDSISKELIEKQIFNSIEKSFAENPTLNKQLLIEKLISENPENKDFILSVVEGDVNRQLNLWKDRLEDKNWEKAQRILTKEDLNER
jgi:hypothetical protein